jgi:ABC-type transport system substrate-binding protein
VNTLLAGWLRRQKMGGNSLKIARVLCAVGWDGGSGGAKPPSLAWPGRLAVGGAACAVCLAATLQARPRYGGTLRIETQTVVQSLDPMAAGAAAGDQALRDRVAPLVYEPLATVDPEGGLRPVLALSWERDQRGARWIFRLRPAVRLHDGSTLDAPRVASSLAAREPAWRVGSAGDAVVIETDRPHPDLPWELADSRFAIAVRTAAGALLGSGAFRIDRVEPRRVLLRAFEDHWAGRPFVDTVQIDEGRLLADQLTSVELGHADLVAVRPTDVRRLAQRGVRTASSRPLDLFAIVFEPHRSGPVDESIRATVASSVDRTALATVLLQRQAEPAATLLPSWLSGYGPSFVGDLPAAIAPAAVAALPVERRTFVLRVDPADGLAQEIAARVSVNVRESGITMTVQVPAGLAPRPDARLIRVKLEASSPDRALAGALAGFGPRAAALADYRSIPGAGQPLESVLNTERVLVERGVIVPLVHVRELYALGERVDSWSGPVILGSGAWNLANVWVRPEPAARPVRP